MISQFSWRRASSSSLLTVVVCRLTTYNSSPKHPWSILGWIPSLVRVFLQSWKSQQACKVWDERGLCHRSGTWCTQIWPIQLQESQDALIRDERTVDCDDGLILQRTYSFLVWGEKTIGWWCLAERRRKILPLHYLSVPWVQGLIQLKRLKGTSSCNFIIQLDVGNFCVWHTMHE